MANLLTNETKRNLQNDLLGRKLVVGGLALSFWLVITLIILGSFWVSLFIRANGLTGLSPTASRELEAVKNPSDSTAWLKKIEGQIKIVNNYWSEPLSSAMMAKIVAFKPAGLKISGLVIERGEVGQTAKIALIGSADNRNELVNYVNLLRQDKFFSRVDLPVESLLSGQGGQFVINLEK